VSLLAFAELELHLMGEPRFGLQTVFFVELEGRRFVEGLECRAGCLYVVDQAAALVTDIAEALFDPVRVVLNGLVLRAALVQVEDDPLEVLDLVLAVFFVERAVFRPFVFIRAQTV